MLIIFKNKHTRARTNGALCVSPLFAHGGAPKGKGRTKNEKKRKKKNEEKEKNGAPVFCLALCSGLFLGLPGGPGQLVGGCAARGPGAARGVLRGPPPQRGPGAFALETERARHGRGESQFRAHFFRGPKSQFRASLVVLNITCLATMKGESPLVGVMCYGEITREPCSSPLGMELIDLESWCGSPVQSEWPGDVTGPILP